MPQLTQVSQVEFPQADRCAACHVQIAHEWADSPHARSFVNPRFAAATDHFSQSFGECLGCHAPPPQRSSNPPVSPQIPQISQIQTNKNPSNPRTLWGIPPQPRTTARESGVTCVSCHLVEGRMAGPLPPTGIVAPHPVSVDAAGYRTVAFCGRCHEGTASQWAAQAAAAKDDSSHSERPTCQDCHMPSVRRKMTQATGPLSAWIVGFEREADEKRHTFSLVPPELKSPPVSIELERDGEGTAFALTLGNRLPHALPTGDFGVRIIEVQADALDAQGQATAAPVGRWELTRSGGGTIAAGGSRRWDLKLPAGTRSVRVRLTRQGRDGADQAVVFDGEVAVP